MEINGKPVVNSKRRIKLEINDQDVKRGRSKDPGSCAAAQCLVRTVPGIKSARVHVKMTYLEFDDRWERLMTPASLKSEIVAFDRGAPFYPGDYTLIPLPPSHTKRYGKQQGSSTNQSNRNGKRRKRARPYHVTEGVRAKGANR